MHLWSSVPRGLELAGREGAVCPRWRKWSFSLLTSGPGVWKTHCLSSELLPACWRTVGCEVSPPQVQPSGHFIQFSGCFHSLTLQMSQLSKGPGTACQGSTSILSPLALLPGSRNTLESSTGPVSRHDTCNDPAVFHTQCRMFQVYDDMMGRHSSSAVRVPAQATLWSECFLLKSGGEEL